MFKKTSVFIFVLVMIYLNLSASAQRVGLPADSKTVRLSFANKNFADIQKSLDEQAGRGYRISDISYHSKFTNIYTKGNLEILLKPVEQNIKYKYLALVTELHPSVLQAQMNQAGENGFHLLKQTPITSESGFLRERDQFIAILENSGEAGKTYRYLIMAYHRRSSEKQRIEQAVKEGYLKIGDSQLGRITYLIMEKVNG